MTEEIIANAGQKAGREIWRVEAFELGVVDPKLYGTFYRGETYQTVQTLLFIIDSLYHKSYMYIIYSI